MKLTPLDIHHKEFHRAIRGYNEEEVDKFLDEVAEEFERLFKENIELKEQLEKIKQDLESYLGMEKTLHNTLLTAQKSAEDITIHAQKESELILRDAELKGKEIIQEAYDLKHKYETTLSHLKEAEEEFRNKFKSMLESYMRIADSTAVLADIGSDIAGIDEKPSFGNLAGSGEGVSKEIVSSEHKMYGEESEPSEEVISPGEKVVASDVGISEKIPSFGSNGEKRDDEKISITPELPKIGIAKIDEEADIREFIPGNYIGETYAPDSFIPETFPGTKGSPKDETEEDENETLDKRDRPDFNSLAF